MTKLLILAGAAMMTASAASAAPMTVLPGEWEVTSTTQIQSMPGLPPEMLAQMRQAQARPTVTRTCVTPDQAARGPQAGPPDSNCKFSTLSYAGGRMAAESSCRRGADTMTMKMAGTYTPTSYEMSGQMTGSQGAGTPGAGTMAMAARITGRRIGPTCSAAAK